MEKSQAYIIATAIVVAGLIVAAAVLGTQAPPNQTGRYVSVGQRANATLDTQTGTLWIRESREPGGYRSIPLP